MRSSFLVVLAALACLGACSTPKPGPAATDAAPPTSQRRSPWPEPGSIVIERAPAVPINDEVAAPSPDVRTIHPEQIDPEVSRVPDYGLRRGLTRSEVLNLLGPPKRTRSSGGFEYWEYGSFSSVDFDSSGKVMGWADSEYDHKHEGFAGFPIDVDGVAYLPAPAAPTPSVRYIPHIPGVAENGSHIGESSDETGRPKDVYVRGYFRKDGTYVRSHFRSRPRR